MVPSFKSLRPTKNHRFGLFLFGATMCCSLINEAQVTQIWSNTYAGSGSRRYDKHLCFADASGNAYGAMAYSLLDTLFTNQSGVVAQAYRPSGITFCRFATSGGSPTWTRNINANFMSLAAYRFDSSANTYAAVTQTINASNKDIRLYRFTNTGTQSTLFTYASQNASDDEAEDMILDNQGNFLVCGSTNQQNDIIVLKYSSSGTSLWNFASALSQTGSARALRLGVDAISNVYTISSNTNGTNTDYYVNGWLTNGTEVFSVPVPQASYTRLILKDFAVDDNGNSYSVFTGINSNGTYDMLIYKYDLNGSLNNTFVFPCSGNSLSANAKILPINSSNSYLFAYNHAGNNNIVCGRYSDQNATWTQNISNSSLVDIKIDQANSLHVLSSTPGTEIADIRVTKISNTGSIQFNNTFDIAAASGEDVPTSMALQSSGLITVCGSTGNQLPSDKVFALRVNSSGSLSWTRVLFDFTESGAGSYIHPADGSVYISGNSRNSNNVTDMYLVKYNASGVEQWRLNFEDQNIDEVTSPKLLTGDAQGNVYIAGYVNASVSARDIIIYKINPQGIRLWKRVFNGIASSEDVPNAMVCDTSGDLWLVGTTRVTALNRNILVLRYNSAGQLTQNFTIDGPVSAEDIGEDIAVEGNAVYVMGEVSDLGSNKNVAVYKYDRISGNLLWTYIKDNADGDDLGVSIKAKNGPVVAMNLLNSGGIYAGYACRLGDGLNGTAVVLAEKTFGLPNINFQLNDVDWSGTKLAVVGFRGTAASSSAYAASYDTQTSYSWNNTSLPVSPSSFNRFLNCFLTPQGQLFCSGTIRSSSGSDRLSFATFSPTGQVLANNLFGSATGTIDQLGSAYFQAGKAAFSGQSNPQNNTDGYQGLVSLTNFPPTPDILSNQQACSGNPINFSFNILDETPQNVVVSIQSQNTSLLPNNAISFSVSGSIVSVSISGIPDTTATIPVQVVLSDGIAPSFITGFSIIVSKTLVSTTIVGPTLVIENSTHTYHAVSADADTVVWQLSGNGQILSQTEDSISLSFNLGNLYLIRTATNNCGTVLDSLMIVSQEPNQAPALQFSDSLQACSLDTTTLHISVLDETPAGVQITLLGVDSLPLPNAMAWLSGQGAVRTLHIYRGTNLAGILGIIIMATDNFGLSTSSQLHVNFLAQPLFSGISGPSAVLQNSTHTYHINGLSNVGYGTWNFSGGGYFTATSDTGISLTVGIQSGYLRYTVSNACGMADDSILIVVQAPNQAPVLQYADSLSACSMDTSSISITINDETPSTVQVTLFGMDSIPVPTAFASISGQGATRTLRIHPGINQSTSLNLMLVATDSAGLIAVSPLHVNLLSEPIFASITGPGTVIQNSTHEYFVNALTGDGLGAWNFSGGGSFTATSDTSILLTVGIQNGFLRYTTSNACGVYADSIMIKVNPPNYPPIIYGPDSISLCGVSSIALAQFYYTDESVSTVTASGNTSNQQLIPDSVLSPGVDTSFASIFLQSMLNTSDTLSIYITLTDTGGLSVTKRVFVQLHPEVLGETIIGPSSVLQGDTAVYYLSGLQFADQTLWNFDGNGQLTLLNDTSVLLIAGVGIGQLNFMASNSCSDFYAIKSIACIAPNQAPTIILPNEPVLVCPNSQTSGISFSVSDESSNELQVIVSASDSSLLSQLAITQSDTVYSVSFVTVGFSNTMPYLIIQVQDTGGLTVTDTLHVQILQAPASVSISGPDTVMAQSSAEYTISGYTTGATFAWSYGGNALLGTAENLTFTPDQSQWLVYESGLNNCAVWDSVFVFVDTLGMPTSGKTEFSGAGLRIYPNPVSAGSNVNIEGLHPGMWVELLDVSGRRIQRAYPNTISKGFWVSEPLSGGVYLLVIGDSTNRKVQRIVVE